MKKLTIVMLCLGLLLAFSLPANALPHLNLFELNKFKFADYTWLVEEDGVGVPGVPEVCEYIEAIATMTTISNIDETEIKWQTGTTEGAEITAYIYGLHIVDTEYYPNGVRHWIDTTDAQIDAYWDNTPDWDPSLPDLDDQIAAATDGDLYYTGKFTPYFTLTYDLGPNGVLDTLLPPGDDTMTATGTFNLTVNNTGYPFDPIWTDPWGNPAEFTFDSRFYPTDYPNYDYRSEDPMLAQPVPEPATMLLLGSGLLGLAGMARRKFNKKA